MIFRMTLVHSGSACDVDATNGGWKRCGGGKHWERLPQVDECGSFQDSGLQHRMMKLLSNGCWKKRCLRITKDPQKAEWFIVVLYGSVGREIILESLSLGELISFHSHSISFGVEYVQLKFLSPHCFVSGSHGGSPTCPTWPSEETSGPGKAHDEGRKQGATSLLWRQEWWPVFLNLGCGGNKDHLEYIMYLAWRYWNVMYNLIPAGFSGVRPKS